MFCYASHQHLQAEELKDNINQMWQLHAILIHIEINTGLTEAQMDNAESEITTVFTFTYSDRDANSSVTARAGASASRALKTEQRARDPDPGFSTE